MGLDQGVVNVDGLAQEDGGSLDSIDTKLAAIKDTDGIKKITDPVAVTADAVADTGNSTQTPLNANAVFTGAAFDMQPYATWSVTIFSNVASATNGINIQWSSNGTNWDFSDQQTLLASAGNMITFGRKARYVRLVYTNGGTNQTTFRVYAAAQRFAVRQTRKFVGNQLVDQDTGQVVIAALQGHSSAGGGSWVDVKVNPSGAITAEVTNAGIFAVQNNYSLPLATNVSSTLTLTNASTAYQITEPTSAFIVTYCNMSDTDMYWGFATLTSGGILLPKNGGTLTLKCAANNSPFFYCGSAGKVLNYTTSLI